MSNFLRPWYDVGMGANSLPTYTTTLPSLAKITMRAWSLGYNLSEVQSGGSDDAKVMLRLLSHCLHSVEDPGPYHLDENGKLDWRQAISSDWDAALIAARIAACGPVLEIEQPCPLHTAELDPCSGTLVSPTGGDYDAAVGFDLEAALRNVWVVPDETLEALSRGENRFTTTWEGHELVFQVPTGETLLRITEGFRDRRWGKTASRKRAWTMACQIIELDGMKTRREIVDALLSDEYGVDLLAVFQRIQAWNGEVPNQVEVVCNSCGWRPKDGLLTIPFFLREEFWTPNIKITVPTRRRLSDG